MGGGGRHLRARERQRLTGMAVLWSTCAAWMHHEASTQVLTTMKPCGWQLRTGMAALWSTFAVWIRHEAWTQVRMTILPFDYQ